MAHEDCKFEWTSELTPKGTTTPQADGKISILESSGKLKGKHANSTSDFDINCKGNSTDISFTRVDNKNKKEISYSGKFKSANKIKGDYTKTDLPKAKAGGGKSSKALVVETGDWGAEKPPTLLGKQSQTAKKPAKKPARKTKA